MKFFFNIQLPDDHLHGRLNTASVQRGINQMCILHPSLSVREEELGVPMDSPKISQDLQGLLWQGNQPVFIALGVADVNPHVG